MPLYEYRCKACEAVFTRTQTMAEHTAKSRPSCPKCASRSVEPVFSDFFAKTIRKS
jgi:putative FmdB family regulatory protein